MSKIDDLIKQYCPNGVKYKELGDVCLIEKGQQLNKNSLKNGGEFPVMNGGIYPSGYWNEYNTDSNTIIISQGGASAGYTQFMSVKFWAGAHCYIVKPQRISNKYLYYFIKNNQSILMNNQYGAGIPALNKKTLEMLRIPVPPLPVQEEIVRILDAFSSLETELETELEARKKQYEHYRNKLLTFDENSMGEGKIKFKNCGKIDDLMKQYCPNGVEYRELGDVCLFKKGQSITSKHITKGKIPVIAGGKTPAYYHNEANRYGETITISSSGAYAGFVSYWSIPVFLSDSFSVEPDTNLKVKYVYYFLSNLQEYIYSLKSTGGIPHIYAKNIIRLKIPIPPLPVQEEIVRILDKFDSLVNDISEGLPAELNARRQQYEYYRNKLLTFDEAA